MVNIRRYTEQNAAYFITTVTNRRNPVFVSEESVNMLMLTIEYFKIILDYKVFAYCILPEHIHLIIQILGKYSISYIMQMIKGTFARRLNKVSEIKGSIWQKRFYDEGIRNELMLIKKIEYIHNNPIKHDLVIDLDKFQYSSYQHYFHNKTNILTIDTF